MITAIIQARVGSTRFPNKVFADLAGHPLIWHVVQRIKASRAIQRIILATTVNPLDDVLAAWAEAEAIALYRGPEDDVLARFQGAAAAHAATVVVRVTADDPFKDPRIIDQVIERLQARNLDFAYNNHPPSFPEGLDTEVFRAEALATADREATLPFDREHVTQFFYKRPERFRQENLSHPGNLSHLRWTIDTALDLEMAQAVYRELYKEGRVFLMEDILELLDRRPELATLNAEVPRSAMYAQVPKE